MKLYKVVITSVKKDNDVEFWESDSDMEDYIFETYFHTGKILEANTDISDTQLEKVCTIMFKDLKSYLEFSQDDVIIFEDKHKKRYNNYYRIAMSINTEDITVTRDLYSLYQH